MSVVIFLAFFGMFNIIGYAVWLQFVTTLTATGFVTSPVGVAIAGWTLGFRAFDYVIAAMMVILILLTGLFNFRLQTKTAFFLVTFVVAIFWGFVSYFFNYVFIQVVSQSIFNTAVGFFPITMVICTNLHWVMLVEIIVGSFTLYGKKEETVQTLT